MMYSHFTWSTGREITCLQGTEGSLPYSQKPI